MTLSALKKLLVGVFIFMMSIVTYGVESFKVPIPRLRVYAQPSTLSQVLTILTQGQVVQAGSNPGGGFKKVLVTDSSGKKRVGYVALSDVGGSRSTSPSRSRSTRSFGGSGLHNHTAIALRGGVAYDSGARVISDSTGTSYTTSSMTGTAPQFGGDFSFSFSPRVIVDLYLEYKSSSVSGTYTTGTGSLGIASTLPVTISQSFISGGGNLQFYFKPDGSFWLGPSLQVDFGLSANATINTSQFSLSSNQYILLSAVAGYDIGLTQSLYLTPILGFGLDVNASPSVLEGNFLVKFSYRL